MTKQITVEVCVDSVTSAIAAERGGAQRVELCSDLIEGGVTPSIGMLSVVRSRVSIAVHPIIRPRPGDFCYSDSEFECMQRDIEAAKSEGADGIVLGILRPNGKIDVERTRQLVEFARPLPVTFHRAFDTSKDLFGALEDVCATGANRILTSGGEQECVRGIPAIAKLVRAARGRVGIMAAGRIGIRDAVSIVEQTGVTEIHVGLATPLSSKVPANSRRLSLGKAQGREFQRTQVTEESVRTLIQTISSTTAINVK